MENETTIEQNRATLPTLEIENAESQQIAPDPMCTGRCSVCDSGYADVVNAARAKFTLRSLSEYMKNEYGVVLSKDMLHNHFQKYAVKLRQESVKRAYELFDRESATLAVHQKQTLFLASYTFEEIMRRIQNGTLTVGIDEFEKLMKLYYQIMQDPMGAVAPDVMEIYMRAFKLYKMPIHQQSFDMPIRGNESTPPESAPAR